jgi:hypothetical protein
MVNGLLFFCSSDLTLFSTFDNRLSMLDTAYLSLIVKKKRLILMLPKNAYNSVFKM